MKLWRKQRQDEVPDVATSLRHIRADFAALGYPLNEYTDEEIVAGIRLAADGFTLIRKALPKWRDLA